MSSPINRRDVVVGGAAALGSTAIAGCSQGEPGQKATVSNNDVVDKFDAIVIGAGLSGLHAAMILEESGLNVQVLEGRQRIGGRVYTLMQVPGKPEAGGEFVGGNYARMLDAARRLDVPLIGPEEMAPSADKYYMLRGETFTLDEWPDHKLNVLPEGYRDTRPDRVLHTLSHINNPLDNKPLDDWLKPEYQKYDIPHSQYLRQTLGLSDEVIDMMNIIIHADHIDTTSALHELRRYAVGAFNGRMSEANPSIPQAQRVKGGASELPKAMAASLNKEVLLKKTVLSFDDSGDDVTVTCLDGSRYRAKQVICSIPHPVLRNILFYPRLPAVRRASIHDINYGESIGMHFAIKRNFWEDDGLPMSFYTDNEIERFAVYLGGEGGTPSSAIAYVNGDTSFKYKMMTDEQAFEHAMSQLVSIRPSIEGALEPVMVHSCERDVHGAGDWVFWAPGQVTKYGNSMRDRHGNIHFAGEHTAVMERGMEGAFESGERAAVDLLERV